MIELRSPTEALAHLASEQNILVGHRWIEPNDDLTLLEEEKQSFPRAVAKVRCQSGAARVVARALLRQLGLPACAIPNLGSGAPAWPPGVVGSLAHGDDVAVAAVALRRGDLSIGIDIEPDADLREGVAEIVATPNERRRYASAILKSRLLFVAKEAVYKATFPVDGNFLEFRDVEIDLEKRRANTRYGLTAEIFVARGSHLVALAVFGGK